MTATEAILQALPNGGTIAQLFNCIEIAENEIAAFKRRYPTRRADLYNAFKHLQPPSYMLDKDTRIYKAHVRELLERIAKRDSDPRATRAEILLALSELSFRTPIRREAANAAAILFREIFGALPPGVSALDVHGQEAREAVQEAKRALGIRHKGIAKLARPVRRRRPDLF